MGRVFALRNVRIFYEKKGRMKFVSHLDMNRFMSRLIAKAKIPVWFTEGFNQHAYMNFAVPLSLGYVGLYEVVDVKIIEGKRERIQAFEGVVVARRGGSVSETFTVRKISFGCGVERTFPLHTPIIEKIEVTRRGKVRRAKLNYIRSLSAKAARIKELRK